VGAEAPGRTARVALERYRDALERLVAASQRLGAEPVIVILPAPIDLDREPAPQLISAYRNELRSIAVRHNLVWVDGPQTFIESRATNADFYDQVHPSTSGHRLLGNALAEALAEKK